MFGVDYRWVERRHVAVVPTIRAYVSDLTATVVMKAFGSR